MMKKQIFAFIVFILPFTLLGQTNTWTAAGGGAWNSPTNWSLGAVPTAAHSVEFNGGVRTITNVPTQSIGALRIIGNANITLLPSTSANSTLTISSAVNNALLVESGSTLQIRGADGTGQNYYSLSLTTANTSGLICNIAGTLIVGKSSAECSRGAFSKGSSATINFLAGSTYNHGVNAGSIPVANWDISSTCLITGVTGNSSSSFTGGLGGVPCDPVGALGVPPLNLNQSFGNFTWNCAGHVATINLNSQLTDVRGNLTINSAGAPSGNKVANPVCLSSNTNTTLNVGGNFIISNTGLASWFALSSGTAKIVMNVLGNFIMDRSLSFFDYAIGISSVTPGGSVVNVTGNLNISAGLFDWTFTPEGGVNFAQLFLNGDLNLTGTGGMTTSVISTTMPNGKLIFNRNGSQSMTVSNPANLIYTNFEIAATSTLNLLSNINLTSLNSVIYAHKGGRFEVKTGGTLNMATNQILSSAGAVTSYNNAFILNNGANLITANVNGIQNLATGSISSFIASRTFSSAANYTYNGIAAQSSGIFTTTPTANTVNNLTIDNTSGVASTGVTLQQPFFVNGTLSLNQGHVTTSQTNLLTLNASGTLVGGSDNSFVNGPMAKVGNTAFTFPVGKLNNGMRTIGISAPTSNPTTFNAEFMRGNPRTLYPFTPIINVLANISGCEYWHLNRTAGTGNASVTLSWSPLSNCNGVQYVLVPTSLVVARYNNTTAPFNWTSEGRGSYSSVPPFASGTITSAAEVTTFRDGVAAQTPFTLGTVVFNNVLNVNNIELQANRNMTQTQILFLNHNEANVARYEVLYSQNGINFEKISEVLPIRNNGKESAYNLLFPNKAGSTHYFRVKTIEVENKTSYSNTAQLNSIATDGIQILSNPVINKTLRFVLSEMPQGAYTAQLVNSNGQIAYQNVFNHSSTTAPYAMQLAPSLPIGMYNLIITGAEGKVTKTILIQ